MTDEDFFREAPNAIGNMQSVWTAQVTAMNQAAHRAKAEKVAGHILTSDEEAEMFADYDHYSAMLRQSIFRCIELHEYARIHGFQFEELEVWRPILDGLVASFAEDDAALP